MTNEDGSVLVRAPGRVNLIGDHTDYTGGLVFPMAIDRWTEIDFRPAGRVELTSDDEPAPAVVELDGTAAGSGGWERYVAAVVAEMVAAGLGPTSGIAGRVHTTIPIGAGLSSSAALEVALALALGHDGVDPVGLAQLCQRAEHRATGVPTGIMDQLCIAASRQGRATLIDCRSLTIEHVALPEDAAIVVRFVAHRTLEGSQYDQRVAQCQAAESVIGPLRDAEPAALGAIGDHVVRARAAHVVAENRRVLDFAAALAGGDLPAAGAIMTEGHASLRDLYQTSTPVMDAAVAELVATPGVHGARMTGGGFGGCVVALCEPDARVDGWRVRPVDGAARRS